MRIVLFACRCVFFIACTGAGILLCFHDKMPVLAPIECEQLVKAARKGRAGDVLALMAEGADVDYKDQVRSLCFDSIV